MVPVLSRDKCVNCGLCVEVCPSCGVQLNEMSRELGLVSYDQLLGRMKGCYLGHSNDKRTRFRSSSGGIVTSLLVYMLERGIIDGAIVTLFDRKNPFFAQASITSSREVIFEAAGSKYTPVSMDGVLKDLMQGSGKYAFVGLPCHIEALRKSERKFANLKESVVITLGLYCNNLPSVLATKYLLWYFNIPESEVVKIQYRGNGWPGYFLVSLKSGVTKRIPFLACSALSFGQYFCRKHCLICNDQSAELADISLADPWFLGKFASSDAGGQSTIVVRTERGQNLLEQASRDNIICIRNLDKRMAVQGSSAFRKRTKCSPGIMKLLGINSPMPLRYEYTLPLDFATVVRIFRYRALSSIAKYEKLWPLLREKDRLIRTE